MLKWAALWSCEIKILSVQIQSTESEVTHWNVSLWLKCNHWTLGAMILASVHNNPSIVDIVDDDFSIFQTKAGRNGLRNVIELSATQTVRHSRYTLSSLLKCSIWCSLNSGLILSLLFFIFAIREPLKNSWIILGFVLVKTHLKYILTTAQAETLTWNDCKTTPHIRGEEREKSWRLSFHTRWVNNWKLPLEKCL